MRIDFLSHYGSEYYCPVSLLRVYGITQMDKFRQEQEEDAASSAAKVLEELAVEEEEEEEIETESITPKDDLNGTEAVHTPIIPSSPTGGT